MATATPAPSFMKQLASNEKSKRDHALENLRTYLRSRREFTDLELLKLWKGLFYCMWMSDKPRNQQQLARDLAALIEVVPKTVVVPFVDAFWKTMAREWGGIGSLRMDKYLYLIRQYLYTSFKYLSKSGWKDTELIDEFMRVLSETPLNARDPKIPNGMRYHLLDIYVDELEKVGEGAEGDLPVERVLAPLLVLQKSSPTRVVRERTKEALEDERVKAWLGLESEGEEGQDDEEEVAEEEVEAEFGGFDE